MTGTEGPLTANPVRLRWLWFVPSCGATHIASEDTTALSWDCPDGVKPDEF